MRNSKLVRLLKTLERSEFRQFYRYFRSPFFTQSKDVIRLYEYIRQYYPTFDNQKLERKTVYNNLFPKSSFNGPKLRNLILKLSKILEDYLIYLKYQQDDFEKQKVLTKIYGERNLNTFFEKKTIGLLKDLEEQPYRDADFFYTTYSLQRDFYFHPNTHKEGETVNVLKKSFESLQDFYRIEQLRVGLDLKNREQMYPEIHGFEIRELEGTNSDNITSQLLVELITLATTQEEASFFRAKELFLQELHNISLQDGIVIIPALLNYAIRQLSKQEKKYITEVFDLYQIGFKSKLLINNNQISDNTFFNVVAIGSKLKKTKYVHRFILEKEQFLNKESRSDVKTLAFSFLYYNQADYTKVINTLLVFNFSNVFYKINAKTLLIRTYYQLFENDTTYYRAVISSCDSFRRFIRQRKNISAEKKKGYLNFLDLLNKISEQRELQNTTSAIKLELKTLLNEFSSVFLKEWLREKINNL